MSNKLYVLISIPEDFQEKFGNFLRNINSVNSDKEDIINIEDAYKKEIVVEKKLVIDDG